MVSITSAKVRICHRNAQAHLQLFCKSKLQSRQKGRAGKQMDGSSTSSEISFHGLPGKSKRPSVRKPRYDTIVVIITVNSILLEDIQQTFFRQYFCELLENSCSASRKRSLEIFRKFTKNTGGKSYVGKVAGFYRSSKRRSPVKQGVLRKVFAKFTEKHQCQRLYFNKFAGLRQ